MMIEFSISYAVAYGKCMIYDFKVIFGSPNKFPLPKMKDSFSTFDYLSNNHITCHNCRFILANLKIHHVHTLHTLCSVYQQENKKVIVKHYRSINNAFDFAKNNLQANYYHLTPQKIFIFNKNIKMLSIVIFCSFSDSL